MFEFYYTSIIISGIFLEICGEAAHLRGSVCMCKMRIKAEANYSFQKNICLTFWLYCFEIISVDSAWRSMLMHDQY